MKRLLNEGVDITNDDDKIVNEFMGRRKSVFGTWIPAPSVLRAVNYTRQMLDSIEKDVKSCKDKHRKIEVNQINLNALLGHVLDILKYLVTDPSDIPAGGDWLEPVLDKHHIIA